MIERRVQRDGEREAREKRHERDPRLPLQHREPHHREDRRRAAVHDRRAEAAHDPGADAGIGNQLLVVDVLDNREAGADGEAEDRRVDEEADPMRADQRNDDEPLAELLDDRTDDSACSCRRRAR